MPVLTVLCPPLLHVCARDSAPVPLPPSPFLCLSFVQFFVCHGVQVIAVARRRDAAQGVTPAPRPFWSERSVMVYDDVL